MIRSKLFLISFLFPLLSLGQEAPTPYGVLPSARQLKWHEMEMYCLIHYTPTTFQNKEWGYGDADVRIFNPRSFDADQIARAAASAGFKGLISVAKHHDGFCLWPTKTTDYSIASTPWKSGKGDMVRAFQEASLANGLQFGVYLSAWDRNDDRYGTAAYAEAYRDQLRELTTQYGTLFTSWHDGANGGDGYYGGKKEKRTIDRTTYYEWHEKTWPIVRANQPMAMIFSDIGPDMRWVGNEKGFAAETSWATFSPSRKDGLTPVPGVVDEANLTTGDRNGKYWIPAECDVPQRPGWFYHPEQDAQVKTPDQLFAIYLKSVGRGANMNLGLAPMADGFLHANDVKSLAAFGEKVTATFKHNFAQGATIKASNVRANAKAFATENILDGDRYSYYASDDDVLEPRLEISLKGNQTFDIIRLRENIKLGQRLDSVLVEVFQGNSWHVLAKATSIGANRLIKLDKPVTAQQLRLTLYAPVAPTLSDFALFKEDFKPFVFDQQEAEMRAFDKTDFNLLSTLGSEAIDGNSETFSLLDKTAEGLVFRINSPIRALSYLPRQDGSKEGMVTKYNVYMSTDNKVWEPIREGEFSNIQANPIAQYIYFGAPLQTRYIKFVAKDVIGESFTVAELTLYK